MTGDRLFSFGVIDDDDRTARERKPALPVRCLDDELAPDVPVQQSRGHQVRHGTPDFQRCIRDRLRYRCADGGWAVVEDDEVHGAEQVVDRSRGRYAWMTDQQRRVLGLPTGVPVIVRSGATLRPKRANR